MNHPKISPILQVRNLSVVFPNGNGGLSALQNLNFSVNPQEFVCVLGPSGSGKTTLLRVLAGLLPPTQGEVVFSSGGRPRIGFVFQQANLMPWRSALENITLPLELQGVDGDRARRRAQELIDLVGLQGFETSRPRDLSGGMAQRVAIARSLIQDPDLLLLDEPFGALDALTRERMGAELLRIWQADPAPAAEGLPASTRDAARSTRDASQSARDATRSARDATRSTRDATRSAPDVRRKTVLMVTHSISEALFLSDRVLVLTARPGQLCLDLPVDLPRPRLDEMRYTTHFGELSRRLKEAISD